MSRMIAEHDVLLQSMDAWLEGDDPTYYVVPRDSKFERYLEHAPDLSLTPGAVGGGAGAGVYAVSIFTTQRTLDPPSLSIVVNMRPAS